jgi:branched-chain amino acid transport system substrate-binding protein
MRKMLTLGMGLIFAIIFFAMGFIEMNAWALERNVIKVGVACALKRPFGVASLRGAEMAAKEINDAGGVLGAKIQLVSADTEATAPKATEAIEKLFYTDKVDAIVGAYSSEEATAFQEQSAKLKLNIIFHGTTSICDKKYKAEPEKYKYYWNYVPADFQYAEYARDYVLPLFVSALKKKLRVDKINVAVVTDVALWTEVMHGIYIDGVKANPDCRLAYVGKIAREAVDFTAELTEMRNKGVQVIFVAMGYAGGYTFVKQAYDVRLPAMITGMNTLAWSVKDFLKAAGTEAAAYNSSLSVFSMPTTPHTVKLLKEYDRIHGGSPHMDVGATYNGLKAYAKAVEMAKSLNHDKVQQQLGKVRLPESAA